jgi:CheY-like chemotaxis protein
MKKILLADDDAGYVEIMKERLESNDYHVIGSSDSRAVVRLAQEENPDLIILDIAMPDMNGYEVCEQLKQKRKTQRIPILLLTGQDLAPGGIIERCLALGVETFLLKTADTKTFLNKVQELI